MFRLHDGRGEDGGEGVLRDLAWQALVQLSDVGHPTTEHEDVGVEDAVASMELRANMLNFKLVADLPLSEQVKSMGEDANYMRILAFCDALIAKKMVEHNIIFAGFLPCRIAVLEDANGKGWIVRLFNPTDSTLGGRICLNGGMTPPTPQSPVERQATHFALPAATGKRWSKACLVDLEERHLAWALVVDDPDGGHTREGFAHGFCVLDEAALVHYMCTREYHPEHDAVIAWDDPDIGVRWPLRPEYISAKDRTAPKLSELAKASLPRFEP